MATAESVKAKIQGLIVKSNEATGQEDADLTAAVGSLIAGFGQGESGVSADELKALRIIAGIEIGHLDMDVLFDNTTGVPASLCQGKSTILSVSSEKLSGHFVGYWPGDTFNGCYKLVSADFPNVTHLHYNRYFQGCTALTDINMPLLDAVPFNMFNGCTSLSSVNLPMAKTVSTSAFTNCPLTKVILPICTNIGTNAFSGCTALNTIVLRSSTVCSLVNVSALNKTPFANGGTGGTVYVPAALISEYQQATNWSTLYAAGTCNFVAIEGSEYE